MKLKNNRAKNKKLARFLKMNNKNNNHKNHRKSIK